MLSKVTETENLSRLVRHRLAFKLSDASPLEGANSVGETWIPLDAKSLLALDEANADVFVPPLFYDNDTYNRISLRIYDTLLEAAAECGELLASAGISKYRNLVAVFFHEIMRILCAYYFKRYELEYLSANYAQGGEELDGLIPTAFPYVDYDFVRSPKFSPANETPSRKSYYANAKSMAALVFEGLRQTAHPFERGRTLRLLCPSNVNVDIHSLTKCLNESSVGRSWKVRVQRHGRAKIMIPSFDEQFGILTASLPALERVLGLGLPNAVVDIMKHRFQSITCDQEVEQRKPDIVLTGPPWQPDARIIAARYKALGVPVVSIFHGEACGLYDEPVFGYCDNSFADAIIGYGERGCELGTGGKFLGSLFGETPEYIPSTSAKSAALYDTGPIKRLEDIDSPSFMYVPTSFIESGRYGPYRDMHDVAYMQWQKGLMSYASELHPGRVFWKPHVKERTGIRPPQIPGVELLIDGYFEDVIEQADVFIFDYVSTAFTLAAATSKPIIYLDIGLRNIVESTMKHILDRCIYVKADPQDPRDALKRALDQAGKECANRYTSNFSIANDSRPRHEVAAETLIGLLRPLQRRIE